MATEAHLKKIRRAADKAASANAEVIEAMREAKGAGVSLRDIAAAALVSHETVRKFISEDLECGADTRRLTQREGGSNKR